MTNYYLNQFSRGFTPKFKVELRCWGFSKEDTVEFSYKTNTQRVSAWNYSFECVNCLSKHRHMHLEIPEIFLQFSRNNDILKFSERTMDLKQVVKLCLQRELGPQVSCCQRLDLIYLGVIQFKDDNRSRRGIWEDYLDGNVVCVFILWQAAGGALKWKVVAHATKKGQQTSYTILFFTWN